MQNILKNTSDGDQPGTPWILLLILAGYVVGGLLLFSFVAQLTVLPFFDFDLQKSLEALRNPYGSPEAKLPLMIIQMVTSLGAFIIIPILFIRFHLNLGLNKFFTPPAHVSQPLFMTLLIMFCFMVANSIIIEWNQSLQFPEFMTELESWAKAKETQLEKLTNYLTEFQSVNQFIFGLFIIAVIPAIGEELLFRGLLQNLLNDIFKNPHIAIWIAALLFSAFHMQFYGVLPRMLLGALFGYLYYWSGNLTIAMVGHFINNSFTLTMLYLSQNGVIDFDPTSQESTPPVYVTALFFVVGVILLFLFRKYYKTQDA